MYVMKRSVVQLHLNWIKIVELIHYISPFLIKLIVLKCDIFQKPIPIKTEAVEI